MPNPFDLPASDHDLASPVEGWTATYVWGTHPPLVKLIASIQSSPMMRGRPSRGSTATSLAIQMDARVAIDLYERLGELGRSMGWLPQKEVEPPSATHSSEG
jgi:hypothetical protein